MIPIQNIYYMLSYSFQVLNELGYKRIATEEFHNVAELCAAILIKGTSVQLKRGLGREYIPEHDTLSSLRGKIDISESIKSRTMLKKQMACVYDEFSVNSHMNKILKTTMTLLIHLDITKPRKKELRKLLVFFGEVDLLDIHAINWDVQYNRNNQTYRMLISISYLVIKGLLQTNSDGSTKLMDFIDEQRMCRLYEKFILEYYRKEHPEITANASQIHWQLDDDMGVMLPVMQTDIMLSKDEKTLIIDAKYYARTTQTQYDVNTLHSGNLYQIFTYVKNKQVEICKEPHEVAGLLLYAKTDEIVLPNNTYKMSGNKISVKTLDLDCDFSQIAAQLDAIAMDHFGKK
ncbi:5-methylcytosine-specific restriction endonuclease system specificity protein McrC [Clostridium butyricum]|uniref:5-methylcytosine-specific restriction endonuclease system specificity protein McrC n=1 Tax=Clostridium butyricum TaxID=1492 RepID=UPI00129BF808|nr:5-methylcytosine-specific restriction endonuclease system specificity protein McrC [Clostridium butyricum]QGH20632.1 5-methylcytosine-specific restriction endonuclease system specificity protein McrC [Clostridium butyricum]QGH24673.1 5-methylcytosine-specific restriction endonuclease system specificity protein McrC [Clostridium butyricum]